jgi:hypothetical protein
MIRNDQFGTECWYPLERCRPLLLAEVATKRCSTVSQGKKVKILSSFPEIQSWVTCIPQNDAARGPGSKRP